MPRDESIKKVLVIGSGPIVIGQAAEFDYSGSQACRSLREEGVKVVLVNSNPATIQTDTDSADAVYIEPLTVEFLERIIAKEKPDGILPTMGGQTGLNLAEELEQAGIFERYNLRVLGTPISAIEESEDRNKFKLAMERIGEHVPKSKAANSIEDAKKIAKELHYPVIIRAAFTLGGLGSGIVHNEQELEDIVGKGLHFSMIHQVLVEQCVLGWYEFEYEVMRDSADNCITICNMENIDPMGIHTGESIVVAPAQTLSDREHQILRSAAIKIIRALNIAGGCNVQFAVNPKNFEYIVVEVNPRVSRSSALASKATGYPIARVAAKIAIGMRLDEILNSVTKKTPACFEPALDYAVVKIPRWPFDKFRTADNHIGTQMKSTGEVMGIGRCFEEALQKAVRSLDIKRYGLAWEEKIGRAELEGLLSNPTDKRLFHIYAALKAGFTTDEINRLTSINKFFIEKLRNVLELEEKIKTGSLDGNLLECKRAGFSDRQIASLTGRKELEIRELRKAQNIVPVYKMVDTCAAEFDAETPYYYSVYEQENESVPSNRKKAVVLGSGPIRIGQGIEFDYSCVHAAWALKSEGIEAILINNNPETVSTDFDTSDKLYFEPLTLEDVLNVTDHEHPFGVILQFGGQTAINLAIPLSKEGVNILGTSSDSTDIAEDRKRFGQVAGKLGIPLAKWGTALSFAEAKKIAEEIGYPVLIRPSYVLGGRAMEIVEDEHELEEYVSEAVKVSENHPILVDKYLQESIEVDVDAVSDGQDIFIGGIMEHVEHAGVHSGDAAMVVPPQTLSEKTQEKIRAYTAALARELKVVGMMNIQYAVKNGDVYCLEVNPRASRTVPYIAKAVGVQLAKLATQAMLGKKLKELGFVGEGKAGYVSVKEVVFPFVKLPGVDAVLGPEMKSTGEVMGIAEDFGTAFYKAQLAKGDVLPIEPSKIFVSLRNGDKQRMLPVIKEYFGMGYSILATSGTARFLKENDIDAEAVNKVSQGTPNVLDRFNEISLFINTPTVGRHPKRDGFAIRRACIDSEKVYVTTVTGARATLEAIRSVRKNGAPNSVKSLNEYQGKS